MNYQDFIKFVQRLGFIGNEATADASIKAVLGIVASGLDEQTARKLLAPLPEPLTLETLRGHQATPTPVTFEECAAEISVLLNIDDASSRALVKTVFIIVKELVNPGDLNEIRGALSKDWHAVLQR